MVPLPIRNQSYSSLFLPFFFSFSFARCFSHFPFHTLSHHHHHHPPSRNPIFFTVLVILAVLASICPGLFNWHFWPHQSESPILSRHQALLVFLTPMDIVLEIFDTLLFDHFWSIVYPASTFNHPKHVVKNATTTFSSMRELPTAIPSSTQFFQLAPSRYAYMSEWPRDNIWRQFITLYLITWYTSSLASSHNLQSCLTSPLGFSVLYSTSSLLLSPTSSSSTMPLSLTRSISNTKSGLRFAKP